MANLTKVGESVLEAALRPLIRDVDDAKKRLKKSGDVTDHVALDSARKRLTTCKMILMEHDRVDHPERHRTMFPNSVQVVTNKRALGDDSGIFGLNGGGRPVGR